MEADIPKTLPRPPFKKKKPFTEDGVELKAWKMDALPYLVYSPIEKRPKEKDIIRSLKNLAKKADSIIIATDFDREGEIIGSGCAFMHSRGQRHGTCFSCALFCIYQGRDNSRLQQLSNARYQLRLVRALRARISISSGVRCLRVTLPW